MSFEGLEYEERAFYALGREGAQTSHTLHFKHSREKNGGKHKPRAHASWKNTAPDRRVYDGVRGDYHVSLKY